MIEWEEIRKTPASMRVEVFDTVYLTLSEDDRCHIDDAIMAIVFYLRKNYPRKRFSKQMAKELLIMCLLREAIDVHPK